MALAIVKDLKTSFPKEAFIPGIPVPRITSKDLLASAMRPVRHDLVEVETLMKNALTSKVEGVPEMMAYLIECGGKRVRPLVSCLMARACGYEGKDQYTIASVAELLHTATLYHDDVVDHANTRRGKKTANNIFGNKVMVLAGDLMLAHCFSMLMQSGLFEISKALSQTVCDMVEGEILQLQCEGQLDTTLEQYLKVIQFKTASLFAWCAQAAGMVAGKDETQCTSLAKFGYHIGMAFQLVDDLMDFRGETKVIGKDTLNDLQEGKMTMPLLMAIEKESSLREDLELLFSGNQKEINRLKIFRNIKAVLENPDLICACDQHIESHLEKARACLQVLPASVYRTSLNSLVAFLAIREN